MGEPIDHPGISIWYAGFDLATALAEAFGNDGLVDTTRSRSIARVEVLLPLRLLDLSRAAPAQFKQSPHPKTPSLPGSELPLDHRIHTSTDYAWTQRWARTFHAAYLSLHGLLYPSRWTASNNVALSERAFSSHPILRVLDTRPLSDPDPAHRRALRVACERAHLPFTPKNF